MTGRARGQRHGFDADRPALIASDGHGAGLRKERLGGDLRA
jgi:hypothetical protein